MYRYKRTYLEADLGHDGYETRLPQKSGLAAHVRTCIGGKSIVYKYSIVYNIGMVWYSIV